MSNNDPDLLALLNDKSMQGSGKPGNPSTGELPFYNFGSSGHQTSANGNPLNAFELNAIGAALGLRSAKDLIPKLDSLGAYNQGQSPQQKLAGAYIVLSTLAKFKILPPSNFNEEIKAQEAYGALKKAAMEKNAEAVKSVIQSNKGNTFGLPNEQLLQLWSGNEHQNLHAVLFGNGKIHHPIHATSFNDAEEGRTKVLGGYNDKGAYNEWTWFDGAKNFNNLVLN